MRIQKRVLALQQVPGGTVEARSSEDLRWRAWSWPPGGPWVPFSLGWGKVGYLCGDVLQGHPGRRGQPAAGDAVTPAKPSWSSENGSA